MSISCKRFIKEDGTLTTECYKGDDSFCEECSQCLLNFHYFYGSSAKNEFCSRCLRVKESSSNSEPESKTNKSCDRFIDKSGNAALWCTEAIGSQNFCHKCKRFIENVKELPIMRWRQIYFAIEGINFSANYLFIDKDDDKYEVFLGRYDDECDAWFLVSVFGHEEEYNLKELVEDFTHCMEVPRYTQVAWEE